MGNCLLVNKGKSKKMTLTWGASWKHETDGNEALTVPVTNSTSSTHSYGIICTYSVSDKGTAPEAAWKIVSTSHGSIAYNSLGCGLIKDISVNANSTVNVSVTIYLSKSGYSKCCGFAVFY